MMMSCLFVAKCIRIAECLSGYRFSLSHLIRILRFLASLGKIFFILSLLSYPGCHVRAVLWLYWNWHVWSSSDVFVMLN